MPQRFLHSTKPGEVQITQRPKEDLIGNGDVIYGVEICGFSLLDLGFANSIKVQVIHQTPGNITFHTPDILSPCVLKLENR